MSSLFSNAIESIQLGIEDYGANDPRRVLSAIRNFYAGVLLLAKEVLVRAAPKADPKELLNERYKPMPDGRGGVRYESASERTIDFTTIGERFRSFGIAIDNAAISDLNRIRKEVEHYFTSQPKEALREAIAKAFPVVVQLLRQANEEPHILGDAWQVMLEVRDVYEKELTECRQTFEKVLWQSPALAASPFNCPSCHSDLVAQETPENTKVQYIDTKCRACGESISAEDAVTHALSLHFEADSYSAMKGETEDPLSTCPECAVDAYVFAVGESRCAWCGFELNSACGGCGEPLTPNEAWCDNSELCSYCGYKLSKND